MYRIHFLLIRALFKDVLNTNLKYINKIIKFNLVNQRCYIGKLYIARRNQRTDKFSVLELSCNIHMYTYLK